MNKLYINGTQAIIDEQQKFYFSHKVNNLDDFTIINVPVSKTIQLPRCQVNDEVFGYIGELSRTTFNLNTGTTGDNLTFVNFNQTKNVSYELYDGGEIVSEGNIIVDGINEKQYEVTLYDKLINTLEEFDGDEDGNGFLNCLDVYKAGTNDKIEFNMYSSELITAATTDKNLKYTINITDDDLKGTDFRCINSSTNQPQTYELIEEMTQLQARSIKAYDVEYAIPINGVIESINKKYNNIITVDSKLSTYFDELHFNCGKAKKYDKTSTEYSLKSYTGLTLTQGCYAYLKYPFNDQVSGIVNPSIYYIPLKDINNNNITKKNGKYYVEVPITIKMYIDPNNNTNTLAISRFNGVNYTANNIANDTTFGELYLKTKICNYVPGTTPNIGTEGEINVTLINNKIDFKYGTNSTITPIINTNKYLITCVKTLVLEFDFYPLIDYRTSGTKLGIQLDILHPQLENCQFFAQSLSGGVTIKNNYYINISVNDGGRVVFTPNEKFHTGDIVNGKNIFPKVSIKDFLLNLCKYHNLRIEIIDGKINISKKIYQDQNELIDIVNITNVNPKLFNFSKLQLSYELPDNDLVNKNYLEINKQKYGQKNVDLNYTIKKTIKKIEYPVGIPSLIKDTNKIAYDSFAGYYNAGRSKSSYGVTNGFNEKTSFCFLNNINDGKDIYLCNDTYFEAGIKSAFETNVPTEVSFVKTNLFFVNTSGEYTINNNSLLGRNHATKITNYYTVSPYIFNTDGTIKKSLEINKPKYNYANITDSQYTDDVTHYNKYLKKTVEELYNVNNHILECDVIFQNRPETNKIYKTRENVEYIIQDIPEYDKSENYIKGVKLLKVNDKNNYLYPYGKEEGNITILNYTNVTKTGMTVNSRINYTGNDTIVTGGVRYGMNQSNLNLTGSTSNPTITFGINLTGLTKNTLYYIQPFMVSATGIYTYGNVYEKRTLDDYSVPTVSINGYDTITYTTVDVNGSIDSEGGYNLSEYGFVYGTSVDPTTSNNKKITGTVGGAGVYNDTITGLTAGQTYYIRAYAINQNGTAYSSTNVIITTTALSVPSLQTYVPNSVRQNDGYSGGYNLNENGDDITQKGIVIKVGGGGIPSINNCDFKSQEGSGISDFTTYFTGLTTNEGYVVRAYATNGVGTGYGQEELFATLNIIVPDVTTSQNINNLTSTGCDLLGIMDYNGGDLNDIEEYGFVLSSINNNPVVGGTGCTDYYSDTQAYGNLKNGDDFGYILTSELTPNTLYYYRAFVVNIFGVGYGDVQIFYTLPDNPTVDNPLFERPYDYSPNAYFSFDYNSNGYEIYSYGAVFSTSNTTPEVGIDDYIVFFSKKGFISSSGVNFTKTSGFGDTKIGEWYCRMFIYTSLGYIYSTTVNDTLLPY